MIKTDPLKDLEATKAIALKYARANNKNYHIILFNPVKGQFDPETSTYSFVEDDYFKIERPNSLKLTTTDELRGKEKAAATIR